MNRINTVEASVAAAKTRADTSGVARKRLPYGQISFFFYQAVTVRPPATEEEVESLVACLRGRGWVRASRLIRERPAGILIPARMEDAKRKLRAIAFVGRDRVLAFPGSPGYCVLQEAGGEAIDHGIRSHRSQSRKHLLRVRSLIVEKKRRAMLEAVVFVLT